MSRTVLRGRVDDAACASAGEPAGECGEDMACGLLWSIVGDVYVQRTWIWMYCVPHSELAERGSIAGRGYNVAHFHRKRSS